MIRIDGIQGVRDWILSGCRWWCVVVRYRRRLQIAERSLLLAEMERDSLQRQLEAAIDTVQAFGLHNRAIGAEAKVYLEHVVAASRK